MKFCFLMILFPGLGLTFADLTEDAIENIKNVTQQLAQIALNPANTFKVKLNENVIKPFQRGLAKMVDPGGRNFSDTKYNYTYVNYVELGQVSPVKVGPGALDFIFQSELVSQDPATTQTASTYFSRIKVNVALVTHSPAWQRWKRYT